MRYTQALTPPGLTRPRANGWIRILLAALFIGAAAWAAYSYAQEAYLAHRLAQQASDVRQQNALLAQQNQGYHRDIQAITNGTADEEQARQDGYSRPNEKVFLITDPPSPAPAASPSAKASPAP